MDAKYIRNKALQTMPPKELIGQLLEKSIYLMCQAREAMEKKDYDTCNSRLIEAQDIFTAFRYAFRGNDVLAAQSRMLMRQISRDLLMANVRQDQALLAQTIELTQRLAISYKSRLHPV